MLYLPPHYPSLLHVPPYTSSRTAHHTLLFSMAIMR